MTYQNSQENVLDTPVNEAFERSGKALAALLSPQAPGPRALLWDDAEDSRDTRTAGTRCTVAPTVGPPPAAGASRSTGIRSFLAGYLPAGRGACGPGAPLHVSPCPAGSCLSVAPFDAQASLPQAGRRSLQRGWPDRLDLILDVDYEGCVGRKRVPGCAAATSVTTSGSSTCQRLCAGSRLIRGRPEVPASGAHRPSSGPGAMGRAGLAEGQVRPEPSDSLVQSGA